MNALVPNGSISRRFLRLIFSRFCLVGALLSTEVWAQSVPVIINEVLANEPGSAVAMEWAELYNRSDSAVDLSGYMFVSDRDSTALTGLVLPAGGHAVLARTLIGEMGGISFESRWGDGSGVWGDVLQEDYPAMTAKMKLRNSADTVILRGPGGVGSVCWWESDAGDGVSLERVRPDSPDDLLSFMPSQDASGSTPGQINSRTPQANDLALDSAGITVQPWPPREDLPITLTTPVVNVGYGRARENTLIWADDANGDGIVDAGETLATMAVPALGEAESLVITFTDQLSGGVHSLLFALGVDANPANNSVRFALKVAYTRPELVINEYLCDPLPDQSEEWIELYNRSEHAVDLYDWRIGDSISQKVITSERHLLPPGSFFVVCEYRPALEMAYPDIDPQAISEVDGWRALNNTGDRIVLVDDFGYLVDSLTYRTTYDGRSVERIDPNRASGDVDNWWNSVDQAGATPGRKNSVTVEYGDGLRVTVSPNPFSASEQIQINYLVPFRASLTARVFDVNGRKIKTLIDNEPVVSGTLIWDGRDDRGQIVQPGAYVLLCKTSHGHMRKIVLAVRPAR